MTRDQRESIAWDEVMEGLNRLEAAVCTMLDAPNTYAHFAAIDAVRVERDKLKAARERFDATLRGVA